MTNDVETRARGGAELLEDLRAVISEEHLGQLLEAIKSVKYGSITLTIQDGKAVQIDKNEKIRIR